MSEFFPASSGAWCFWPVIFFLYSLIELNHSLAPEFSVLSPLWFSRRHAPGPPGAPVSPLPLLPAPIISDSPVSNQANPSHALLFMSCLFPALAVSWNNPPCHWSYFPSACDQLICLQLFFFSELFGQTSSSPKVSKTNSWSSPDQFLLLFLWLHEWCSVIQTTCLWSKPF